MISKSRWKEGQALPVVKNNDRNIIEVRNASFAYRSGSDDGQEVLALDDISLSVRQGEFLAVLGRNGSGKSTLAKLMNALILPVSGTVIVDGIDTTDEEMLWDIRSTTGMVFQTRTTRSSVQWSRKMWLSARRTGSAAEGDKARVDEALEMIGMSEFKHAPHQLSGGQKQRVAIAGILAMRPKCIVLDEATAMLDPVGRRE